jgi:hypothetical protein
VRSPGFIDGVRRDTCDPCDPRVAASSDRLTPTRGRQNAAPILSLLTSGFLDGRGPASERTPAQRSGRGRTVSGRSRAAGRATLPLAGAVVPVATRHVGAAAAEVRMGSREVSGVRLMDKDESRSFQARNELGVDLVGS